MSSNGRTYDSGSYYRGSSPCIPATIFSPPPARRYRLGVRTGDSQSLNRGSNPRSAAILPRARIYGGSNPAVSGSTDSRSANRDGEAAHRVVGSSRPSIPVALPFSSSSTLDISEPLALRGNITKCLAEPRHGDAYVASLVSLCYNVVSWKIQRNQIRSPLPRPP
jgi:hypothetical protein